MVSIIAPLGIQNAATIPYVTPDEAYSLLNVELHRLLALLEILGPDDWAKPTACTLWNVRDMVAHQTGGYASGVSYREMIRQYSSLPKRGQLPEDAVNELQIRERAEKTPAELIAELRSVGQAAIHNWAYRFNLAKLIAIPHPVGGVLSLRHLMTVIHSRDTWMHRLDICRATGRSFEQTAGHDGRIAALVMLDVEKALRNKLGGKSILFNLAGTAGGAWLIGQSEPSAIVQMDVLEFNILVSGRNHLDQALSFAAITGDHNFATQALKNLLILF